VGAAFSEDGVVKLPSAAVGVVKKVQDNKTAAANRFLVTKTSPTLPDSSLMTHYSWFWPERKHTH
jgi:hypothetical protein